MAEKNNKGFLEKLNRTGMALLSPLYNASSGILNLVGANDQPYIDPFADGFMQGGFSDQAYRGGKEYKEKLMNEASGVASLKDDEFYKDKILRDLEQEQKKNKAKEDTKKKETTKVKEETKDDRGMLQKLFEKYDLVSLGNSIGRGEGLLPAIEAQDASIKQEAKDLAAARVTAAKTEADISYKLALAQQALREKNPEFIRTLTAMGIDPTDPQALALYKDKISKSSSIDPMMLMLFKNQGLITDAQFDDAINSSIGVATTPGVEPVNLTTQD